MKISVVGVGCGGLNAVSATNWAQCMGSSSPAKICSIVADTEQVKLRQASADFKIQLGKKLTSGMGAAGNPDTGRAAAEESSSAIQEYLRGSDLVFVAAGLGGGTGTGASPVVAELARRTGALVVGIATMPFSCEATKIGKAQAGLRELQASSDALLVIPNDRLLEVSDPQMPLPDGYRISDQALRQAIQSIAGILSVNAILSVDFADLKKVLHGAGRALMGVGDARGDKRAVNAARAAAYSRLLEDESIEGAQRLLINITGPSRMTMVEFRDAMDEIQRAAKIQQGSGEVFSGVICDPALDDMIRVTVVAAGFPERPRQAVSAARTVALPAEQSRQPVAVAPPEFDPGVSVELEKPAFLRYNPKILK